MPKFTVHLYREMRLKFTDIEASCPEEAATIASRRTSGEATEIEDCEGLCIAALVDYHGDENFSRSEVIDFAVLTTVQPDPREKYHASET
jgi:hypothetical protein